MLGRGAGVGTGLTNQSVVQPPSSPPFAKGLGPYLLIFTSELLNQFKCDSYLIIS